MLLTRFMYIVTVCMYIHVGGTPVNHSELPVISDVVPSNVQEEEGEDLSLIRYYVCLQVKYEKMATRWHDT